MQRLLTASRTLVRAFVRGVTRLRVRLRNWVFGGGEILKGRSCVSQTSNFVLETSSLGDSSSIINFESTSGKTFR